jgi:hypothetical protein
MWTRRENVGHTAANPQEYHRARQFAAFVLEKISAASLGVGVNLEQSVIEDPIGQAVRPREASRPG